MALIACRECQREVGGSAKRCPRCEARVKRHISTSTGVVVILIAAGFFALLALTACASDVDRLLDLQEKESAAIQEVALSWARTTSVIDLLTEATPRDSADLRQSLTREADRWQRAKAELLIIQRDLRGLGIDPNAEGLELVSDNPPMPSNPSATPISDAPNVELVENPCDGPRPYQNWSNAELNAALVETMGTDQSAGLITEGACRQ